MIELKSGDPGHLVISIREDAPRLTEIILIGDTSRTTRVTFLNNVLRIHIDPNGDRKGEIAILRSQLEQQKIDFLRAEVKMKRVLRARLRAKLKEARKARHK